MREAVQLLNSVLNKNGYTVIRNGRTLRVMSHDDAIHGDIPVKVSNEPDSIPKNDEIVTQIIPIRYVQARQLVTDLSVFVSPRATIMANDAGNSIVVAQPVWMRARRTAVSGSVRSMKKRPVTSLVVR